MAVLNMLAGKSGRLLVWEIEDIHWEVISWFWALYNSQVHHLRQPIRSIKARSHQDHIIQRHFSIVILFPIQKTVLNYEDTLLHFHKFRLGTYP